MEMVKSNMLENLRLKLQFFAEGEGDQDPNNSGNNTNDENGEKKDGEDSKTYTDKELQAMMAKEKKQGKNAGKNELMKELGIENLAEFKKNLEDFNKYQEDKKTESEKQNDKLNSANSDKTKAEQRAKVAEAKLDAIKNGVNPKYVDDVISIALNKVDDDNTLEDVIEGMKETHKFYFSDNDEGEDTKGTGTNPKNKKVPTKVGGIGERLAKTKAGAGTTKSLYFNN